MSKIPNPFLQGSPEIRHASPPVTPNSAPGFLVMTRPAGNGTSGFKQHGRGYQGQNRPNQSYGNHSTHYSSPIELSPRNQDFIQFGNQRNQRGHNARGNGNQRFSLSMDNASKFHHPYQSPNNTNIYKNNSYMGSPSYQNSPHQFRGHRGRGFGNRNSFSNSQNNSFQKNNSGSFHRTPLKDVPIDKFISQNMVKDPWREFEFEDDTLLQKSTEQFNLLYPESSETFVDTRSSSNVDCVIEDEGSESQSEILTMLDIASDSSLVTPSTSEKDTATESDSNSDE